MAQEEITTGKGLHLKIMTPSTVVFDEDINHLTAPGEYGDIGVLPGHISLLSNLRIGIMDVTLPDKEKTHFAINKGFLEIANNKITVLTETAENPEAIDLSRAEDSLKRAQSRLDGKSGEGEVDKERAKDSLMRAKVRISVARTLEKY